MLGSLLSRSVPSTPDVEYAVDSDLPGVSGSPTAVVPARGELEYRLSMCPQFGGVFTGSITFTAPGGIITWFTVEVRRPGDLGHLRRVDASSQPYRSQRFPTAVAAFRTLYKCLWLPYTPHDDVQGALVSTSVSGNLRGER